MIRIVVNGICSLDCNNGNILAKEYKLEVFHNRYKNGCYIIRGWCEKLNNCGEYKF
jgi:hypothetical protein